MPTQAWSIEDVRAAEEAAMADLAPDELMRRASAGLAYVVRARVDELVHTGGGEGARVVVLAGSGGNGGDALYAAADLAGQDEVAGVVAVAVGAHLHPRALDAAREAGVDVVDV